MTKTHSVYAVHFSDNRIKVGVTSSVVRRMAYYAQEARRNRVDSLTWWSCAPLSYGDALCIEKHFCRQMRECSMPRHREWFDGDAAAFGSVLSALERMRSRAATADEVVADIPFAGQTGQISCGVLA
jgi:predicted GIY-YIG superfamily endonuclease